MRSSFKLAVAAAALFTFLIAGAAPALARDRNHNKLPDSWETKYRMSLRKNQAKLDFDKDGISNGNEYLCGTSPRRQDTNHNGVKDGLEDRDKDGLVNLAEFKAKTSPKVKDTDHDGVLDAVEDPDGDGLNNAQEWACGTHPLKADTNADGIADGEEDADADGLNNAQEFVCGTDPREADTDGNGVEDCNEDRDGDGINNYTEFEEGTDPCDPDSDHDGVRDGVEIRGTVSAFDPETGRLTVTSTREDETDYALVIDSATVLKWGPVAEGAEAPDGAPTIDDLYDGVTVYDLKTVPQDDGSLLVIEITIVPDVDTGDPGEGALLAEVAAFDADTSTLTLLDLTSEEGDTYEVLVDGETTFAWADGTGYDHEAGIGDLVEGTGVADYEVSETDDGSMVLMRIVLVPSVEQPAE